MIAAKSPSTFPCPGPDVLLALALFLCYAVAAAVAIYSVWYKERYKEKGKGTPRISKPYAASTFSATASSCECQCHGWSQHWCYSAVG